MGGGHEEESLSSRGLGMGRGQEGFPGGSSECLNLFIVATRTEYHRLGELQRTKAYFAPLVPEAGKFKSVTLASGEGFHNIAEGVP
jgi:hypothetical protein